MSPKRVAVVGAGPCGIGAIKCLKEENIEPICFERTKHFGGLWRYHDDDVEGIASVMKTTVINSSKEMSSLSDFPPPANLPNYMHNTEVHDMIKAYAEKFDLLKHIIYNKEVVKVELADDYKETGRLKMATKDTVTGEVKEDIYDGVIVCTGHHVFPNMAQFKGQEKFKGKIMHTHSLKKVDEFEDQVVVVVGAGNSAADAAVEISSVSKQVYLSTRRGAWVMPRVGPAGIPYDVAMTKRINLVIGKLLPSTIVDFVLQSALNKRFDHALYKLKPKHRVLSQHPTVSDSLPIKLLSGVVKVRGNIKEFTEDGVIFENETEVTKADSVVLATGYKIRFPFVSKEITSIENNSVHMYKFMYPPHLPHGTFVIAGLIQPIGGGFPVGEAQCRLAALVLNGKVKLPSQEEMEADIEVYTKKIKERFVNTERHTIQVDYTDYMDELYEMIGAKPNFWKIFFTDPKLYFYLMFGPAMPYQYRLQGPHAWPGARDAILTYKERIVKPLNSEYDGSTLTVIKTLFNLVVETVSEIANGLFKKLRFFLSSITNLQWKYIPHVPKLECLPVND